MEFHTKEQLITNYITGIDFNKDDWGYRKIQEDLKKLIGETPAINFNYKKDVILNEFNSEAKEVNVIESVDIIYTPNLDEKGKLLNFKVGKLHS